MRSCALPISSCSFSRHSAGEDSGCTPAASTESGAACSRKAPVSTAKAAASLLLALHAAPQAGSRTQAAGRWLRARRSSQAKARTARRIVSCLMTEREKVADRGFKRQNPLYNATCARVLYRSLPASSMKVLPSLPREPRSLRAAPRGAARRQAAGRSRCPSLTRCAASAAAWTPESWRTKKAVQMPDYADPAALQAALTELRRCPPLIFAGEARPKRVLASLSRCRPRRTRLGCAAGAARKDPPLPPSLLLAGVACFFHALFLRALFQVRELRKSLAKVANGEAFLLQARGGRARARRCLLTSERPPHRAATARKASPSSTPTTSATRTACCCRWRWCCSFPPACR